MTTVTLNTDESLLAKAEAAMARRKMSLDDLWAETLREVAAGEERARAFEAMMEQFRHFRTGGPYTRDELNER